MTRWELWRQDDNGNRFLVWAGAARAEAEERLVALEAGHPHKQLYWIAGPDGPGGRGPEPGRDGSCTTS